MNKKKIIIISIAVVLVIVGIILGVVLGKKSAPVAENTVYSAEVKEEYIEFYKNDELIQTDKYPDSFLQKFDIDYAKEHIEFVDMNFDGNLDACLAISKEGNVVNYICWIYENERFVYNKELSQLTTISVDDENKEIIAVNFDDNGDEYVVYEWKDGNLIEKSRTSTDSPDIPTEIIEAVQKKSVGIKSDDTTKSRSETTTISTTVTENTDNKSGTTKNNNSTNKNNSTTKKITDKKDTTKSKTTEKNNGVILATGDMDDGWF